MRRRGEGARPGIRDAWVWAPAWLVMVAGGLASRTLYPVDETRYATVAWEMWLRGRPLVPFLDGRPYADKPPLLFWIFELGWRVAGVSEGWVRLVPPLFALGCLALVSLLAWRLWPGLPIAPRVAPLILLGSLGWAAYGTFVLFDAPLTFFALASLLAIVRVSEGGSRWGWGVAGVFLGLAILTKGPVAMVHVMPVGLLAPWWGRSDSDASAGPLEAWSRTRVAGWYASLGAALLLAAAAALFWALPAAAAGGPEYGRAILWGQTASRVVRSFAHARPFWWYLPLVPLVLLPWSVWPRAWRDLFRLARRPLDRGTRFCLAWVLSSFLTLSAVSGKQAHYLLPLLPGVALLLGRALAEGPGMAGRERRCISERVVEGPAGGSPGLERNAPEEARGRARREVPRRAARRELLPPVAVLAGVALGLVLLPHLRAGPPEWLVPAGWWKARALPAWQALPAWLDRVSPAWGLGSLLVSAILVWRAPPGPVAAVRGLAVGALALLLAIELGPLHAASAAFDLRPVARRIAELQAAGAAVASLEGRPGQYGFLGRLRQPVFDLASVSEVGAWSRRHPGGAVVVYYPPQRRKAVSGVVGATGLGVGTVAGGAPHRARSKTSHAVAGPRPDLVHPFRDGEVAIWRAEALALDPDLAKRRPEGVIRHRRLD